MDDIVRRLEQEARSRDDLGSRACDLMADAADLIVAQGERIAALEASLAAAAEDTRRIDLVERHRLDVIRTDHGFAIVADIADVGIGPTARAAIDAARGALEDVTDGDRTLDTSQQRRL